MRLIVGMIIAACLFAVPAQASPQDSPNYNAKVIRQVFGSHGSEAVRVSWCESRLHIWARNGQYLGLFQMGRFALARYGHGWNAWAQARAAYRYFRDAGGWSPWSCQP